MRSTPTAMKSSPCLLQLEKAHMRQRRPNAAKNKLISKKNRKKINNAFFKKKRTSLVAQWLRICLPMQGTQVRSLVQEDPTCRGATKPVCYSC